MNLVLNRSLTFGRHLMQRGEKKIYLSVGNSSRCHPVEGKFWGWGGEISVVYFQEEWTNSIAPGHSRSDPCGFLSLSIYFFFPPRLPHYVVILDYFSHSVFLLHSVSHTHAHTKPMSILQCLCCEELSCEMAGCYIREESAVSQRTSQRSAERDQIKERGRGFTLKSVQRESQMRIYGQQATVTHRQLLALFVIISVFLDIDSLCSVTKGKLLHVHLFSSPPCHRGFFSFSFVHYVL